MPKRQYYSAQEAMKKLGMPRSTFFTQAGQGLIHKKLSSGKTRGALYLIEEEDGIARPVPDSAVNQESEKILYRRALPQDAQEMYEFAQRVMETSGGYGIPAENRIGYLSIPNSEIGHVLIRDNHIIGFFTMLPLKHEDLLQLMRNEIRATEIPVEKLVDLKPDQHLDYFIWEVMSDPDNKHLGAYLIKKLLTFFHTLGKRGVEVDGIYAKTTSPEGRNLAYKIGMKEMELESSTPLGYTPFELKIQQTKKSRLTKNYIQALASYKRRHKIVDKFSQMN